MIGCSVRSAAVFLDRDGTLIRDVGYLRRADDLEILPGVPAALGLLRAHGFKLVVVTNQSAVARGWMSEQELVEINQVLASELAQRGAPLDAIYYCPHHPVKGKGIYRQVCSCRKPKTGMIERACVELGINAAASYAVGDQKRDIELAGKIGVTGVLIGAPLARREQGPAADDLGHAAQWIIEHSQWAAKRREP